MIFCLKVLHLILKLCYTSTLVVCHQSMSVATSRLQKRWLQLEPKTKPQICQTYPQSQVQRSFQKKHTNRNHRFKWFKFMQRSGLFGKSILQLDHPAPSPIEKRSSLVSPRSRALPWSWTFRDVLCIYNFQRHIFPVSLNKTCQISPTEMSASPFLEIVGEMIP